MSIKKSLLSSMFITLLLSHATYAESPVWRVDKDGHHLYIGGTIHLLTESDYPLPPAFNAAYKLSSKIILETDVQQLQEPEVQHTLMQNLSYPPGESLSDVLGEKTYQALQTFCTSRNIPLHRILKYKAGLAAMLITLTELQRLGLAGTGVDEYYHKRASTDHKSLGYLESVEQQLTFMSSMGDGEEDALIDYTLREVDQLPLLLQTIKKAWRRGDLVTLEATSATSIKHNFESIHNTLLVERNNNWMPQIEALIRTREVELVLVGSLHLAGKHGLLAKLVALGFNIQQL